MLARVSLAYLNLHGHASQRKNTLLYAIEWSKNGEVDGNDQIMTIVVVL